MAWTAPATFTDGAILTAAQLNVMRDNFNETAPAKATSAAGFIVTTALNSIVQRTPLGSTVTTSQTTTSTSYVDLATIGPTVTVTTGPAAMVALSALMSKSTDNTAAVTSYEVTGASSQPAVDGRSALMDGAPANQGMRIGVTIFQSDLTPGSNTFTQKYKVSSTTGTFSNRHLVVIPF